jgi:glyoxylase-like metal-dependent hydrolase (beta-lactamase superfamily II)
MNMISMGKRILALKIDFDRDGGKRSIYPAILCDENDRILVDCGYPGFLPRLEQASALAGIPFGEITGIVITHHDYDHYGALREITEKYPHIRAMSSEFDTPYIEGKIMSLRISRGIELFDSLSEEKKNEARKLYSALESVKPAKIDRTLKGGDVMPWCGGTEVMSTPGHMPGHISLYVRHLRILITGDALVAWRNRLMTPSARYATDAAEAKNTAQKLLAMDVAKFICYHGGVVARPFHNQYGA